MIIKLKKITKKFNNKTILNEFTTVLASGNIIGIYGDNGVGKTTLMKIIAKLEMPSNGRVMYDKEKIIISSFFQNEPENESLSSGERTKAKLLEVLKVDADLYLLDEPSNHLDESAKKIISDIVKSKSDSIVIITSHDRYFLNLTCNKVFYYKNDCKVDIYKGNFDTFWVNKSRAEQQLLEKNHDVLEKIEKLRSNDIQRQDKFSEMKKLKRADPVKVFRKKRKFKHQNKIYKNRIKRLLDNELPKLYFDKKSIDLNLTGNTSENGVLYDISNLEKKIKNKELYNKLNFQILNNEKILLTGPNGSGKTTLLKIISGIEKDYLGVVEAMSNIDIYYFRQENYDDLNYEYSVREELIQYILSFQAKAMKLEKITHHNISDEQLLEHLEVLEFDSKFLDRGVESLSEGEKVRLRVAKIMLNEPQLLLLDEPTNHLDRRTKNSVITALSRFKGAMIVITHDPEIMDAIKWDFMIDLKNKKTYEVGDKVS